jgi:biotin operon repressor
MTDAERVLRLLTNASVKQADMAFVLGISTRKVQECLQALRLEGKPIYSDKDGIRLAATSDEALACYRSLRARSLRQMHTARRLLDTAIAMQKAENRPPEVEAPEGSLWRIAS